MDSAADSRVEKQPTHLVADADLISGLDDDVLLHILRFLPTSRDVLCTAALSRRWRHLWKRAPVLRLNAAGGDDGLRFNDVVGPVLARRARGGARIDALAISAACCPSQARADGWIRVAMQHVAGSFSLFLPPPPTGTTARLRELPRRTGAAGVSLSLGHATLPLPATAAFRKLTDLSLVSVRLLKDQGDRLGRLLSSPCCPRLRTLRLSCLRGLTNLRLDGAGALEDLELALLDELRHLHVDAGGLRVLHISSSFMLPDRRPGTSATVMAPELEELACTHNRGPARFEFDGWSRVRRLEEIAIRSHLRPSLDAGHNDFAVDRLRRCTSARRLLVRLEIPKRFPLMAGEDVMADIPELPHVEDLTVKVDSPGKHAFGASVANLLARCSNLQCLHVETLQPMEICGTAGCICDQPENWDGSLEHLHEVKFDGFAGCYVLGALLLARAPALEGMTVAASEREVSLLETRRLLGGKVDDLGSRLPRSRGWWTARAAADPDAPMYRWAPDHQGEDTN